MSLMQELKKRNVFRVAIFYLVSAWVILQVGTLLFDIMELPIEWKKGLLLLLIVGFPVALITSWVFEVTPDGVKLESDISGAEAKQNVSAAHEYCYHCGGNAGYLLARFRPLFQ